MAEEKNGAANFPRPAKGFCVNVELRMSPDKGVGVFAAEFIPANTVVYYNDTTEDSSVLFDENEARKHIALMQSVEERVYWISHVCPLNEESVVLDPYDIPMINHSRNPTVEWRSSSTAGYCSIGTDGYALATRNISKGEELTEDYRSYPDTPFLNKLMEEYGITEEFINYS